MLACLSKPTIVCRSTLRCGSPFLWIALLAFVAPILSNAQNSVVISEFLAHNTTGLVDEDGATSDWIELFNPTTNALNMIQYSPIPICRKC